MKNDLEKNEVNKKDKECWDEVQGRDTFKIFVLIL